jgi:hypothetical protein
MAILSTANTTLNYCATQGGVYTKLCDIVSYPDMGSAPSKLDTTDLSATTQKTNILGLQDAPDLTFECNYDEAVYNTLKGLTGTYWFNLFFGALGADGIFEWQGKLSVFTTGGGVDEVRKMSVVVSNMTPITFEYSA